MRLGDPRAARAGNPEDPAFVHNHDRGAGRRVPGTQSRKSPEAVASAESGLLARETITRHWLLDGFGISGARSGRNRYRSVCPRAPVEA